MERDIELDLDGWRAVVSPACGGRLRALTSLEGGRRVNWIKQMDRQGDQWIGGAGLWLAQAYPQEGSLASPAEPSSAWVYPPPPTLDVEWQVTEQSRTCVALVLGPRDPSWGGGFQARQMYRLDAGRVEISLALRNLGRRPLALRMGWRLEVPDGYGQVSLDLAKPAAPRPARGQGLRCDAWGGQARLDMVDGRQLFLSGPGTGAALTLERHPQRPWMTLTALTPTAPDLTPLASGEEWMSSLTLSLRPPSP